MGYQTNFSGVLKFKKELTIPELKKLEKLVNYCDPDEHPEFIRNKGDNLSYIQLEITPEYDGIRWDGNEKFYYAVEAVNFVLLNMRVDFPDFGLEGELKAQGEEIGDVWTLAIKNGIAVNMPCAYPWEEKTGCLRNERIKQPSESNDDTTSWEFGLIEFHSNNDFRERFYHVVDDLRNSASIVDIWLYDIQRTLAEFGYIMTIQKPKTESADNG